MGRRLLFFPGSTISNFTPQDARTFLADMRSVLRPADLLFIGVDRVKDARRLELAYDDAEGVTAAFNRNLLVRIRRELDSDFEPSTFVHRALYNQTLSRIEMHLVSTKKQVVHVSDRPFHFEKGESIHTENSYKYSTEGFTNLAQSAGFEVTGTFSDPEDLFSLYLCRVPG
jgi:dimethylhistidine N-methyltransferase